MINQFSKRKRNHSYSRSWKSCPSSCECRHLSALILHACNILFPALFSHPHRSSNLTPGTSSILLSSFYQINSKKEDLLLMSPTKLRYFPFLEEHNERGTFLSLSFCQTCWGLVCLLLPPPAVAAAFNSVAWLAGHHVHQHTSPTT